MDGFTLYVTFLFSLVCFDWSTSSINSYCIEIISLLFHSFLPEDGLSYVSLPYLTFLLTLRLLPQSRQGSASLTLNLHDHKGGFLSFIKRLPSFCCAGSAGKLVWGSKEVHTRRRRSNSQTGDWNTGTTSRQICAHMSDECLKTLFFFSLSLKPYLLVISSSCTINR